MNKLYFVESELYPRTDFANESDRNEMALALWEEQIYFLWARTLRASARFLMMVWGAIIWMKWQKKPWIWKVTTK